MRVGVAGQRISQRLARCGIPESHGRVPAGGDEDVAIAGAPAGHRGNRIGVLRERRADRLAGASVPDAHGTVLATGDDDRTVFGSADGERHDAFTMSGERLAEWLAGRRVPQPHRAVHPTAGDDLAVAGRTDRHDRDSALVARQEAVTTAEGVRPARSARRVRALRDRLGQRGEPKVPGGECEERRPLRGVEGLGASRCELEQAARFTRGGGRAVVSSTLRAREIADQ